MIFVVLATLLGAGIASGSAQFCHRCNKCRAPDYQGGSEAANVGAVTIKLDAVDHHLDVFFAQAGGGALFTGRGAGQTSIDAGLHGRTRRGLKGCSGRFHRGKAFKGET